MRAALLISGYSRGFSQNLESFRRSIFNNFENLDCYVHLTIDETKQDKYLNSENILEKIQKKLSFFSPKSLLIEPNNFFSPIKLENDLFNTWFKFFKLNTLRKIQGQIDYDVIIKARPDLHLISEDIFKKINIEPGKIYIPKSSKIDKSKLINPSDPYLCDSFAFGKEYEMNFYFEIYKSLKILTKDFGFVPETILYHYLKNSGIEIVEIDIDYEIILSKCNVFAICGDSGSGKTTLSSLLKKYFNNSFVLECDRYHKWERGDDNWKRVTHLNPDANYISKMNEDIFNLKIGKSIYQVDYDHSIGKFTESEKIDSSENIIVCGLHSLYNKKEDVYDLKIFMDPQDDLKKDWKIRRDTEERGYSLEKIKKQINERKNDYEKYILPQRDSSDVIVSFVRSGKNDDSLSLELYVSKSFFVTSILDIFKRKRVKHKVSFDGNFVKITFVHYKKIDLWEDGVHRKTNDFYDYIVYIILHLK